MRERGGEERPMSGGTIDERRKEGNRGVDGRVAVGMARWAGVGGSCEDEGGRMVCEGGRAYGRC